VAVASELVETGRVALLMRDFDLYLSCFALPNIISTWDTATAFETPRDLRRVFDGILANFDTLGVIRYERTCQSARFIGPFKIEAVDESRVYDRSGPASPAAITHSIVELVGDHWAATVTRQDVAGMPILKHAFNSGRPLLPDEAATFGWDA